MGYSRIRAQRRLAALALSLLAGLGAASPACAAGSAKLTASLSATSVPTGTTVTVSGKLKPGAKRTIRLEDRRAGVWTSVATTTSAKQGTYRLTLPTPTAGIKRLRTRALRNGRFRGATSPLLTLTVTAPVLPPCCKTNAPSATPNPTPAPTGAGSVVTTAPSARSSFRALYVLASDQTADPGEGAAITADINALGGWFATQTDGGVRPRWVRDGSGAVPITTITLPRPATAYAAATFSSVVAEIATAAPTPANQKTVAWFNVGSPNGCGVTGSDVSIVFEAACDIHPSASDVWPYGASYLAAHEMTHNFGAVKACAPHQGNGGHVIDDPRDVLFAGNQARDWDHLMLDPGHDDYYDTGRADCPGIEGSPFWTATSDPLS